MNLYIKKSSLFSMKVLSFIGEVVEFNSLNLVQCNKLIENDKSFQLEVNGVKLQVLFLPNLLI